MLLGDVASATLLPWGGCAIAPRTGAFGDRIDVTKVFPMQLVWRATIGALGLFGLAALVLGAVELLGVVERGRLIGEASDAERVVAVVVGTVLAAIAWTAWRNARLVLDEDALAFLRFGLPCRQDSVRLADVRRWGVGHETNRGYRHRIVLLELADRSRQSIKLEMYALQQEFLAELERRLGSPAPVRTGFAGVAFEDE